ncbi:uncharacterized protein K452DRAFT_232188 [Aplosporella prunicola CBS 121167]|uniref:Uncharacterized protein n=1 Tax=Aplosporella prunicola CBS 121167 TaxID=1176127 RepID=A0A6A6B607_9PEZI|nr:uncharacterized protein K452DRAFT_232188 [Aplosporella prunicola CBS 121167]KAF2139562.1 hypothetical protein K452DRAFT_232188 [Aplosporella prunicola CBS 121167]
MPRVVLLGTCDTKLDELLYTRARILSHPNTTVELIDAGRTPTAHEAITIPQSQLLTQHAPADAPAADASTLSRGALNKHMAACAANYLKHALRAADSPPIHGIISLGGSGGTSLAAAAMHTALPLGFPKLIVSTIASGDTGPVVGEADITLMYSVVDVAGLNDLLQSVLDNAAGAIAGMAAAYAVRSSQPPAPRKARIGITMFGVTTPCVERILKHYAAHYSGSISPPYVFHATGHGGRAMEALIARNGLDGVLDLTTTELCDLYAGGAMAATPARLDAAATAALPCILSLGACDMVNFGPRDTVPERYAARRLFEHNSSVTLMRTNVDECRAVGEFVARKLRCAKAPQRVQVWVPRGGVSALAVPDGPFADSQADEALFRAVNEGLADSGIDVVEDERAINDEGFAVDVAEEMARLLELEKDN